MKYTNILVWGIGVGLIVLLAVLTSGLFDDQRLLLLDGGVLVCCWTLSLYVYGGLYASQEEFARDIPSTGVKMFTLWLYVALAVLCIGVGLYAHLSFGWQTFLQLCFLFLVLLGMLASDASIRRMTTVADKSQQRHQATDILATVAQQVQVAAMQNKAVNTELSRDIARTAERVGMLTPGSSPMARQLDDTLRAALLRLKSHLEGAASAADIASELDNVTQIVNQRMKTY